ncbi:hypothetical protein BKA70DRAFT_1296423 [Coprinopsis sp. MPI-PUGE-AT-0042]|nr:hypothetical protein BKA70DRAFT_1296423 [Coprinopsis sp. MPI-PUGE-AT-0042]
MDKIFSDSTWFQSSGPCTVSASSHEIERAIWFKSPPIDHSFWYRVALIQLTTDSRDQGWVSNKADGIWSWFELAILPDAASEKPRKSKEDKELVWRSHHNRLASSSSTRHFGITFDRRSELFANIQIGDVLAIRVCARFSGWENDAQNGFVTARVLDEDFFLPRRWSLSDDTIPTLSSTIEGGCYSVVSNSPCILKSVDNKLQSKIWFTTGAFDEHAIKQLEALQLFTVSRCQQIGETSGSFSWFDLVILEAPHATSPKIKNGVSLVWRSHCNGTHPDPFGQQGQVFDIEISDAEIAQSQQIVEIKDSLEPGNVIGVRVCTQYRGWENHALSGQLVVRIRNQGESGQGTVHGSHPSENQQASSNSSEASLADAHHSLGMNGAVPPTSPAALPLEAPNMMGADEHQKTRKSLFSTWPSHLKWPQDKKGGR